MERDMTKEAKHPRQDATRHNGVTAPLPDPRNPKTVTALTAAMDDGAGESDLYRAQDMAWDAMDAPTRRKRIALARQALAISPLCADAYVILASETADPEAALALYRRGVEVGTQALGEATFETNVGDFWGLLETRPYMRAREGLARSLWESGERDQAISHYQDMLRLNPNDNQGIRYSLIDALLELGRDREAGKLLRQYKDDASAAWAWSGALLSFRRNGDAAVSRGALARAIDTNSDVPPYLLGSKKIPRTLPDYISLGGEDEAIAYVHGADSAWVAASGAKTWVSAFLGQGSAAPSRLQRGKQPVDDPDSRIDDAVLALLLLGLHDGDRAWKSFDWDSMDRLHRKGLISDPVGRTKSVRFTEQGLRAAKETFERLFVRGPLTRS
jgi:tetratricopeptide (TPR) repeat protein